jgi:hypothetical protein
LGLKPVAVLANRERALVGEWGLRPLPGPGSFTPLFIRQPFLRLTVWEAGGLRFAGVRRAGGVLQEDL